jgi:hypothetical protein
VTRSPDEQDQMKCFLRHGAEADAYANRPDVDIDELQWEIELWELDPGAGRNGQPN